MKYKSKKFPRQNFTEALVYILVLTLSCIDGAKSTTTTTTTARKRVRPFFTNAVHEQSKIGNLMTTKGHSKEPQHDHNYKLNDFGRELFYTFSMSFSLSLDLSRENAKETTEPLLDGPTKKSAVSNVAFDDKSTTDDSPLKAPTMIINDGLSETSLIDSHRTCDGSHHDAQTLLSDSITIPFGYSAEMEGNDISFIEDLTSHILDSAESTFCSSSIGMEISAGSTVLAMCTPLIQGDLCLIIEGVLTLNITDNALDDQTKQRFRETGASIARNAIHDADHVDTMQITYLDPINFNDGSNHHTEALTNPGKASKEQINTTTISLISGTFALIAIALLFAHTKWKGSSAAATALRDDSVGSGKIFGLGIGLINKTVSIGYTESINDTESLISDSEATVRISNCREVGVEV